MRGCKINLPKAIEAFEYGAVLNPSAEVFDDLAGAYSSSGNSIEAAVSLLEGILMDGAEGQKLAADLAALCRQTEPGGLRAGDGGAESELPGRAR